MQEITGLLKAYSNGDKEAFDKLMPLVERELHKIAKRYMSDERQEHVLQTTALVNEAIIKLIRENLNYESRKHFYGVVKRRMRHILIDHARKEKRNGLQRVDFEEAEKQASERSKELLRLDDVLTKFAEVDKESATIVEYHFFLGLSFKEIAELLDTPQRTLERRWEAARAWLKRQMTE